MALPMCHHSAPHQRQALWRECAQQHARRSPQPTTAARRRAGLAAPTRASSQPAASNQQSSPTQRLYSNLNPKTLKHEPGSVAGAALLVAGTTVGAGILALPAVTAEAGFPASLAALAGCCLFSIATGLLLAEVHLKTMATAGAGSTSLLTMVSRTLGKPGALLASGAYVFLHYALLVAYISKAGEILAGWTDLPLLPAAATFAGVFGGFCYLSSQQLMDRVNGALVVGVVASFLGLLAVAAPGIDTSALTTSHWAAVPATLPVVALSFVYHNVVPVVGASLEGDAAKVRTAIVAGVSVPFVMFASWEAAILGSLPGMAAPSQPALGSEAASEARAARTSSVDGRSPALTAAPPVLAEAVSAASSTAALPAGRAGGRASSTTSGEARSDAAAVQRAEAADPLALLAQSSGSVGPLIQAFSFLAIATSYIGFVLGLTDFFADAFQLPGRRQGPLPYAATLLVPFGVAVTNPGIFLKALDAAGTYGVLTLFGILPAAMAWVERERPRGSSSDSSRALSDGGGGASVQLVPGGRAALLALGGSAAAVILYEVVLTVGRQG